MAASRPFSLLALALILFLVIQPADAFGAGSIAAISKIKGHNWRHGDIEETLKTVAHLKGHKWTTMMIKRVYFGNWLRDYSQAIDVGTLTKVPEANIRILVWILSFMAFGYATAEFEVTSDRLGCYRPEEHIDNPSGYPDNASALDNRLRGPVRREELQIDPRTGMKNYIANESGGWATSSGYVKYSLSRSIHFGRMFTSGPDRGDETDLCEALRCLGQGLHCLEDFGAHTQYVELALRELGFHNVFPHVGSATEIDLGGRRVYPLVTGTFGGVDFLHSVLGEVSDHVTQSEVDDLDKSLGQARSGEYSADGNSADLGTLTGLLRMVPGGGDLSRQAENLQEQSDQRAYYNARGFDNNLTTNRAFNPMTFVGAGHSEMPTDPEEIIRDIYPILQFRDNVVRFINGIIAKIPGLEALVEKITETVTLFVMRLLAPYIMPLIATASQGLKQGSSAVVHASSQQQYLVFDDPHSSDPTHSMLSKDHFSNVLNEPAGKVAAEILKYAAPRVVYAWEHPEIPVEQVVEDILQVFHHPVLRNMSVEVHRVMFNAVEQWIRAQPNGGRDVEQMLTAQSVRAGNNHRAETYPATGIPNPFGGVLGAKREAGDDTVGPGPGGYQLPVTIEQSHQGLSDSSGPGQGGYGAPPDQPQSGAYSGQGPIGGFAYVDDERRPGGYEQGALGGQQDAYGTPGYGGYGSG